MNSILDSNSGYTKEVSRDFFKNVYGYMFGALLITGLIASYGSDGYFLKFCITEAGTLSPLYYVLMFAPIGVALLIQMAYARLSYSVLILCFILYSVLMGMSMSTIFLVYTGTQIASTFFITAGAFGAMAIIGYTTKTDLTKMGSLLYMVFIGMFIASIVNMFIGWDGLQFIISILGVFVFTGLTAYYMQKLKGVATNQQLSNLERNKLSLVGGLMLYIMFINLFMSLLSLTSRD